MKPGETKAGARCREVTVATTVFGLLFGAILNAAITYSGLKIGFTISGSAIAAVIGFGILRGLLRRGTILEVNIGQTLASAVNIATSGVIFTIPVLFLIDKQAFALGDRTFWLLLAACTAGGVLGVVFIVPVRKQMIDIDRLRFPSATAVAAILKSPGAGTAKTVVLLAGILIAMLVYLPAGLPAIRLQVDAAKIDQLDKLVEKGKITSSQAQVTRDIHDWILRRDAPDELIERGRVIRQMRALQAAELGNKEPSAEVTELAARAASMRTGSAHTDDLAVGVMRATDGEIDWDTLRSRTLGWATVPLWGYSDLDIRMGSARNDTEAEIRRVDRDGDGKPDLVVTNDKINAGRLLGLPDEIELVFAIAPFAIGAGYLTGRAGLMVLAGGILAFFFVNPIAFNQGWMPATVQADQAAKFGYEQFNRPLGIGLLMGGALMGIVASLPAIKEAFKSIAGAGKSGRSNDEMSFRSLVIGAILAMGLLFLAAELIHASSATDPSGLLAGVPSYVRHAIVALVGVAWMWFAGIIIAQCVGMTDWSPISAMSLLTVVLVMALAGPSDVVGAVMIGAALCCAITCASDMMQDLRTGHLVGGKPRRQQLIELFGVIFGPAISLCTVMLIVNANLVATGGAAAIGPGTDTAAAQAQTLHAIIKSIQGGDMPYALYGFGAILGGLLGLGAFSGLGVLVGLSMILPFFYILTYGIGCILNMIVGAIKGRAWAEEWGVPFCAGLIVGEALLALVINATVLAMG